MLISDMFPYAAIALKQGSCCFFRWLRGSRRNKRPQLYSVVSFAYICGCSLSIAMRGKKKRASTAQWSKGKELLGELKAFAERGLLF